MGAFAAAPGRCEAKEVGVPVALTAEAGVGCTTLAPCAACGGGTVEAVVTVLPALRLLPVGRLAVGVGSACHGRGLGTVAWVPCVVTDPDTDPTPTEPALSLGAPVSPDRDPTLPTSSRCQTTPPPSRVTGWLPATVSSGPSSAARDSVTAELRDKAPANCSSRAVWKGGDTGRGPSGPHAPVTDAWECEGWAGPGPPLVEGA